MKNSEFENILDDCLERLAKGETLEQCLQSYPEQAAQLEPLLQTAQIARKVSAILPRSEFKARARYEFRSALQATAIKKRLPLFGLRPRWAMALMITAIFLIAGGSTAVAANNSMPDSPLYPVKLATEQVQLTLTPSDISKARLCVKLADRRVAEIIYMANKGDVQRVDVITRRLDKHLVTLTSLVSAQKAEEAPRVLAPAPEEAVPAPPPALAPEPAPAPAPTLPPSVPSPVPSEETEDGKEAFVKTNDRAELRVAVVRCACNHPAALRAALGKAPESVKPALRRAIAVSEADYKKALAALD